jgi:CDP-diacylglycerol--glycerol-3-phosphate 3-phosphatidyltransferase
MTAPDTTKVQPAKPTLTDRLRRIFFPVIDPIVTVLAHWKLSPDLLTVLGMLAHFILAALIATGQMRWAGVGLILIAPLDALDGSLARKLGRKQGGFGAFLDSTLDRLAEIILYGGFIYYYYYVAEDPRMLAISYLAVSGSLMVSYVRSKAESLGLDCKVGVFSRVERYLVLIVFLLLNLPDYALIILAVGAYFTLAHRIFYVWRQAMARDGG